MNRRRRAAIAAAVVAAVGVLGQIPFVFGALGAAAEPGTGALPRAQPAAAAAAHAPTVAGGPSQRQPAGETFPITVTVRRLDPREIRPDSTITVVVTLTNTLPTTTGPLRFRLQRGALMSTRSELAAADDITPSTLNHAAGWVTLNGGLAPGQTVQVTYRCPATGFAGLNLVGLGVYPVAFEVRAIDGFDTLGRAQTLLPYFPPEVAAKPTRIAWLWPLLDRPHRLTGDGGGTSVFTDDGLALAVRRGGRLDRLLAAAERVTSQVRLTLVVDPETIEALDLMSHGYRIRSGARALAGSGQRDAADWLARLREIAPRHVVAAVPYADPDIVALRRGGVDSQLYRLSDADLTALEHELSLPVAPSRLAWPPGGVLTDGALDDLVDQGVDAVVLDSGALPRGITQETPTPSAVSPLPALRGQTVAMVTDAKLQRIVAQAVNFPGGVRLAEQRYLAELAMITAQRPDDQRTYVITPPRRWLTSLSYAQAVLGDTGAISWLTSLTVPEAVSSTQAVDRGPLSYPASAQRAELSPVQVQRISQALRRVADLRTALTNSDANTLLAGYDAALRRAASSAWRDDRPHGETFTGMLWNSISWLRSRVTVVRPTTGIYTLTSSNSPLSLTVRNNLRTPVTVVVSVNTTNAPGFVVHDIGPQQIPAGSRTTLRVPAEVKRAGTFSVLVQLTTPEGGDLGDRITLTVRSTAYGAVALGITGVALVVLVGAVLVRLVRRLRADADDVPPPGTPADRSVP